MGETDVRWGLGAEGATAPETLRQTDLLAGLEIWKEAGVMHAGPPTG